MKASDLKIGTSILVRSYSGVHLPAGVWIVLIISGNHVLLTKFGKKKKTDQYPGLGLAAWRLKKNIIRDF